MAEVTLGFDELEDGDLPLVCMECGSRKHVDFVQRKFVRRPLFAPPGLIGMAMTKRVHAAIPLCEMHGGPRLFGYQGRSWWGLQTVAVGKDRITLGRVHEDFADALRKRRKKRSRGEFEEFEPSPRRVVRTGRGPGGGATAFKVLVIIGAVFFALVLFMTCGMFGLMAVLTGSLQKSAPLSWPVPSVPIAPVTDVPPQPQNVVVGLFGVAPAAGLPGAVPWTAVAQTAQKETFQFLDDAELNKLLADLKSPHPAIVEKAADRLSKTTPEDARRKEVADALEGALANPFPMAKKAAAQALGKWGAAEDLPSLIRLLGDPNPTTRAAAMTALAALKDERGAAAVAQRLSNFFDRDSAKNSLEEMGPMAQGAVMPLLQQADARVRADACEVLKVIGGNESLPALDLLVRDPAPQVVQAAAEAKQAIRARN